MEDTMAPTVYTIDLSLPPRERYAHVAAKAADTLHPLSELLDMHIRQWKLPIKLLHFIASLLLYQLHSFEQTEEIKGMCDTCNIPLYILIVWNVSIDVFLGCTSGGAAVNEPGFLEPTMMHFRALDWSQHVMRRALAQFEFVEKPGGPVIARTLGFVGHVGVLTGVRKGLSVSISWRPSHDKPFWSSERLQSYWHTLMVVLGMRPSICTLLRDCLLPRQMEKPRRKEGLFETCNQNDEKGPTHTESLPPYAMDDVIKVIPTMGTSLAYITFCTPTETVILEKHFCTAKIRRSSTFIHVANHDDSLDVLHALKVQATDDETMRFRRYVECAKGNIRVQRSLERNHGLKRRWSDWEIEQAREENQVMTGLTLPRLIELVRFYPVINARTYFLCVMDPKEGVFRWVEPFAEGQFRKQLGIA
ncbi:NAAA-beta domain containing protein [Pyrenophora tritici-repentis]|nr:NAAA-beta domain containing protein [Pyrenophora tritici-repentis]